MTTSPFARTLAAAPPPPGPDDSVLRVDSIFTTSEVLDRWGRLPRADPSGLDRQTGLLRVARGAWVDRGLWETLPPWAKSLARHYAAQKTMPEPPTFCLGSAAMLWRLPVLRVPPRPQVIAGAQGGSRRTGRPVTGKVWPLRPMDVTEFDGFHLTSLIRTAVDCARELPVREGLVVMDGYMRRVGATACQEALLRQLTR